MEKAVQISPEVADVLSRAIVEGPPSRPVLMLPPGQLERPLYEAVDKVLRALGGKWDRKSRAHVFGGPLDGRLAEALMAGRAVDLKRTREQFFTPPGLAAELCDLVGDIEGQDVLEPSAGDGRLVREIVARGGIPHAVEIDQALCVALSSEFEGRVPVDCTSFMGWSPRPPYSPAAFDAVLMNPPFSGGQDMAHVWRAYGFLKPGGRLGAIMSPHWTFAMDRSSREFREEVRRRDYSWTTVPPGAFKAEGTSVSCGILTLWKGENE